MELVECAAKPSGVTYDCSAMNRHEYSDMVKFAKDFVDYYNAKQAEVDEKYRPFKIYGQVVDRWPNDKDRRMTSKELQAKADEIDKEEEELDRRRMPTDNMRPDTQKRVPEKHDLALEYNILEKKQSDGYYPFRFFLESTV